MIGKDEAFPCWSGLGERAGMSGEEREGEREGRGGGEEGREGDIAQEELK